MEPTGKKLEDLGLNELCALRSQVDMELERRRREDIVATGGHICRDCGQPVSAAQLNGLGRDIRVDMKKHALCQACRLRRRCRKNEYMLKSLVGKTVFIEAIPFTYFDEHGGVATSMRILCVCKETNLRCIITGMTADERDGSYGIAFEILPGDTEEPA